MNYFQQLNAKVKKGKNVFIAPTAIVLGAVELADTVSIWYHAVLRADHDTISIGEATNIQDHVLMHVDEGFPISIGKNNVIGHAAIIHGASIGDDNLIGMRSTILNGAKIGKGCIIGAHALITEGMEIPDYSMVLGTPGKIVKQLDPQVIHKIRGGVESYLHEAAKYLND